jgi:hypothetical protein
MLVCNYDDDISASGHKETSYEDCTSYEGCIRTRTRAIFPSRNMQQVTHACDIRLVYDRVDVNGSDLHILKHILHDWSDEQSVTILRNCASALHPKGRIILIEWLLQEKAGPGPAALSDLNMLVLLPGRERSAAQLVQLLRAAALRLERITEIASSLYVLEASPAVSNAAT